MFVNIKLIQYNILYYDLNNKLLKEKIFNRKQMKYLFIIFFSILLISCSGTKESTREDIKDKLKGRHEGIKTLGATGSVMMSFPDGSNSGRFKLSSTGADSILFEIFGPFGITVGKLYARSDYFLMLNSFNAEAYEGIPDEENLKGALNLPVSFYDFIRLFRNETPGEPVDFELHSQNSDIKDALYRNRRSRNYAEFALFSKEQNAIVQYQKQMEGEGMVLNAFYSDFADYGGYRLARKIVYRFPKQDGSITFNIDKYLVNESYSSPFVFSLPSSIKPKKIR